MRWDRNKHSRQQKGESKNGNCKQNMSDDRRMEEWEKSTEHQILLGGLEVQTWNRRPSLVATCSSGLIYDSYWILQHLSWLESLSLTHVLFSLLSVNLPSTSFCFGIWLPSPPFTHHFFLPLHLLMSCLLSSWAFCFRLFSTLAFSGSMWFPC